MSESLDRSFGFAVHDVSRLMRKVFDKRVRALGLTRAQWRVISFLRRYQGPNQVFLADVLEMQTAPLGRLLDRLEVTGWIERRPDPRDRRAKQIFLTPRAAPVIEAITRAAERTKTDALAGLSRAEQEDLIDTMLKIKANLMTCLASGAVAQGAVTRSEIPMHFTAARTVTQDQAASQESSEVT
jgi:DNA-binding MarR family transcriptional regulator